MSFSDNINIFKWFLVSSIKKNWLSKKVTFNLSKNKIKVVDKLDPCDIIGRDKKYYKYIYRTYPLNFIINKCRDIYGSINDENIENTIDIIYDLDDGSLEIKKDDLVTLVSFSNHIYRVVNILYNQGRKNIYTLVHTVNINDSYIYSSRKDIMRISNNPSYYYRGYYKLLTLREVQLYIKEKYKEDNEYTEYTEIGL